MTPAAVRSSLGDAIRTALRVSDERRAHLEQLRKALESDDAEEVVRCARLLVGMEDDAEGNRTPAG